MTKLLLIGLGGASGAVLRYVLSGASYRILGETFPWGTLVVNVLGCLCIGFLWAVSERYPFSTGWSVFVFTGVLGGFTTFSTYGLESFNLMRDGEYLLAAANVFLSNLLGLTMVVVGFILARLALSLAGWGGAS